MAGDDPQGVHGTEPGTVEQLLERVLAIDPPEQGPLALAQPVPGDLVGARVSSGRAGSMTSTIPGAGASSPSARAASAAVTAPVRSPASIAARAWSMRCAAR